MLPKFVKIRDLKQAEEIIKELVKAIEDLNRFVYSDIAEIEEHLGW